MLLGYLRGLIFGKHHAKSYELPGKDQDPDLFSR
ncbi:MAG: hypothetical protein ACI909_001933 [Planctomycetota bacterium]|jgi:hypothetical protein